MGREFGADSFSFSTSNMWFHCPVASIVSDKQSAVVCAVPPDCMSFFLWLHSSLSFLLAFSNSTVVCLGVIFFVFIQFKPHWFWNCTSASFTKFVGGFSPYILSISFSIFFPFVTPATSLLDCLMTSHRSLRQLFYFSLSFYKFGHLKNLPSSLHSFLLTTPSFC